MRSSRQKLHVSKPVQNPTHKPCEFRTTNPVANVCLMSAYNFSVYHLPAL